jgi:hypothetical protein
VWSHLSGLAAAFFCLSATVKAVLDVMMVVEEEMAWSGGRDPKHEHRPAYHHGMKHDLIFI